MEKNSCQVYHGRVPDHFVQFVSGRKPTVKSSLRTVQSIIF